MSEEHNPKVGPPTQLQLPRFILDPYASGVVGYRLYISDGEASKCYIQALLPVRYHYSPKDPHEVVIQETHRWQTLLGPLEYNEAVAVYSDALLEAGNEGDYHNDDE